MIKEIDILEKTLLQKKNENFLIGKRIRDEIGLVEESLIMDIGIDLTKIAEKSLTSTLANSISEILLILIGAISFGPNEVDKLSDIITDYYAKPIVVRDMMSKNLDPNSLSDMKKQLERLLKGGGNIKYPDELNKSKDQPGLNEEILNLFDKDTGKRLLIDEL